jgi:hypothetical protein
VLQPLQMDSRYVRGKAFNTALLASSYALQCQVEQACAAGREAIDRAVGLDSARAVTYIRNLLHDLAEYQDVGECRELTAYARTRLPALRRRT